ncbi:DUF4405 domain-containing protein [Paraglaciecola polaris]|uniref:Flavinylation-associated cytochrome domain-containing protein n=2 Tax=Paraglaciecola polaris TaxID=222814 RepID=K6YLX1_9ALTE|nr:DUF4405 domain-containing protein [Paraglaciecola polaris]GAC33704.1 hypothetical protein GPLA_2810 [Paraglaciecola polaris LMG 21857]|tara:strand:- start:177 stop:647 length:471 start_codon:yes stop_codon:yes gene_type:complete
MSDWTQNLQKTRYVMDTLLLISFMMVSAPQTTGVPLHEWLSLLFVVPFAIHLLLHWDWIKQSLRRFSAKISAKERFSLVWNYLLYVVMLLATVSGFLVSVALLPAMSISFEIQDFWSKIHHDSATLIMPMLGIHLALHWSWIVNLTKRMGKRAPAQ